MDNISSYDKAHVAEIIDGLGDWFGARLIRVYNELLPHADMHNRRILWAAYPDVAYAVFKHWGWSDEDLTAEGLHSDYRVGSA
jgi:hypothetical protein